VVFLREENLYHPFMMTTPYRNLYFFDQPAIYQIIVQGRIDPTMSERMEGMTICQVSVEESSPTTTLEGELGDQAALAGVLNSLYELHLPVILVKRLDVC
jgi:hypothetical protein